MYPESHFIKLLNNGLEWIEQFELIEALIHASYIAGKALLEFVL